LTRVGLATLTRRPALARADRIDDLLPTFDQSGHYRHPVRVWEDEAVARLTRAESRAHVRACIDRLPDPY
jgi:hypothetical protein